VIVRASGGFWQFANRLSATLSIKFEHVVRQIDYLHSLSGHGARVIASVDDSDHGESS